MKTVTCYYSRHHGNIRKILEAMAQEGDVELLDITTRQAVRLEHYDCAGFASGVYFGKFHDSVLSFARQHLPTDKPVFFVCTYGAGWAAAPGSWRPWRRSAAARCWGPSAAMATTPLAPSNWWAASPRGRSNEADPEQAHSFYQEIQETHDQEAYP